MRALVFHGIEDVRYDTVADPGIEAPTDVIVRAAASAICGSDLHPYHGREAGLDPGTVMGHEFSGEVVAVGDQVTRFRKGDRVVSPFTTNCGTCFYCTTGLTCRCVHGSLYGWISNGHGLHGTQAEYVRVPLADATLMHLPDDLDWDVGLMLGDILPTGYYAAVNAGIIPHGTYAVVGCGPVGLMAILCARHLGASRIYALDRVPARLAAAEALGAMPVDVTREDAVAVVGRATQGRGADGVMELVGAAAAARLAYDLVRPGGTLSVAGVHTDPHFAFSPEDAYNKNLTYKVGRCPARHFMQDLLPLAREAAPRLRALISHRLPLTEGRRGYQLFAARAQDCTKVVFTP